MKKFVIALGLAFVYGLHLPKPIVASSDCSIEIQPAASEVVLSINAGGAMPAATIALALSGDDCEVQSSEWQLNVEYWDGWAAGSHKILPWKLGAQRAGMQTQDGWSLALQGEQSQLELNADTWGKTFGGGVGTISVSATLTNGQQLQTYKPLTIYAQNPQKASLRAYLGSPSYQILGYLESKFIQFFAGKPLLNCGNYECLESDGGFGLMQITLCEGAEATLSSISTKPGYFGSGIPSYRQIWDWKANAAAGVSCFEQKLRQQCWQYAAGTREHQLCGYSAYNGSRFYGDLATSLLNEIAEGRFRAGWY